MSLITASRIPGALISGIKSYVATLGEGIINRDSPGNAASCPPEKKNVTCGYFSVSAMRNCVFPAFETTSPSV